MTIVLTYSEHITAWFLVPVVLCILLVPINISGYLEQKKWAVPLEGFRVLAFLALLMLNPYPSVRTIGVVVAVVGVVAFLLLGRNSQRAQTAQ